MSIYKSDPHFQASLRAFQNGIESLHTSILSLLELMKSAPDGDFQNKLFNEINRLNSIADTMQQTLDSMRLE